MEKNSNFMNAYYSFHCHWHVPIMDRFFARAKPIQSALAHWSSMLKAIFLVCAIFTFPAIQARASFGYSNVFTFPNGFGALGNPVLIGKTLYGIEVNYNSDQYMVYKVNIDGSGYQVMHIFNFNAEGSNPHAGLVTVDNQWLYGTTSGGGPYAINGNPGYGSVFAININDIWTDGQDTPGDFYVLYNFGTTPGDGYIPNGPLLVIGSSPSYTLYGTSFFGGVGGGNIFALQITMTYDSQTESAIPIYAPGSFSFASFPFFSGTGGEVNAPGAYPVSGLVEANLEGVDWLYGTTRQGGLSATARYSRSP